MGVNGECGAREDFYLGVDVICMSDDGSEIPVFLIIIIYIASRLSTYVFYFLAKCIYFTYSFVVGTCK